MANEPPIDSDASTVSLPEAARLLGVSKTTAYDVARTTGKIAGVPVLQIGGRYVVPTAGLRAVLGGASSASESLDREPLADLLDDIAAALARYAKRIRQ